MNIHFIFKIQDKMCLRHPQVARSQHGAVDSSEGMAAIGHWNVREMMKMKLEDE